MAFRRVLALLACACFALAGCAQPAPETADDGGPLTTLNRNNAGSDGAGGIAGGADGGAGAVAGSGSGTQPTGGPPPGGMAGTGAPPTGGPMSGSGGTSGSGSGSGASGTSTGTGVYYDVPQSVHQAAWLCQTPISVDDLRPAGTDDQECKVTLTFTSTQVTVVSTGIPNHDYDSGGGCCTAVQSMTNVFPLRPQMASSPTYSSTRGAIAIAVNGVAIFGPEDSNDQDVVIWTATSDQEPQLAMCGAHAEPNQGTYHYHSDANCIHWHAGAGEDWYDYDFSKVAKTTHSKIIGFAKDGFPIYGTYGYAADNVTIKEITSSYRLKTGATGANGIADQEYVAGLGDLDECNGRFGKTPEFPDGIYHYYSTRVNGAGSYGFPYFPLCYKGVVSSGTGGMTGGGMSTGGMSGGGMSSGSMSGTQTMPPPGGGGGGGGSCPPPGMPPPPGGCPP